MLIKGRTYIFVLTVLCLTFAVYFLENKVHSINEKMAATEEKLLKYDEDLKVLESEWSYLNNPDRLTKLAEKIETKMDSPVRLQYTNLKDLPVREVQFTKREEQLMP